MHPKIDHRKALIRIKNILFNIILRLLKYGHVKIYKTTSPIRWDKKDKRLRGLLPNLQNNARLTGVIFLSADRNDHPNREAGSTLVHELLHIILPTAIEPHILSLEMEGKCLFFWDLLSKEQKQIIKSYIPKHTVKITPKDLKDFNN